MSTIPQGHIGSSYIARDLGITTRTVNNLRKNPNFPPVLWIGNQWRISHEAYEEWKLRVAEKEVNQ